MEFHINKEELLQRFLTYVQIDSETGQEGKMAEYLYQELTDLGMKVEKDTPPDWVGSDGFNIHAILPGDENKEPILFSSHMDTVVPGIGVRPQVCDDGYVRSSGDTILGGDDKAGIAAIVQAVIAAQAEKNHATLEILFTVREEVGLLGAKGYDYSQILAKKAMVLDSGGDVENITTIAPGQNRLTFQIQGKTAHAGIAPETGVSAIQIGALAVSNMNLLRVDQETTSNIGTFQAESPTNIVCDKATLILEVRSRNNDKLAQHTSHMEDCVKSACEKLGGSYELAVQSSYQAFRLEENAKIVADTMEISHELGLKPVCIGSGGGSDANVFNQFGIETLNLAIGMEKVHTVQEQLNISQMNLASEICYRMMIK